MDFLPYTLTRKLDANCYKVLSICMNIRNSAGMKRFNASDEMISYFSGASMYIVRSALAALIVEGFLLTGGVMTDEDGTKFPFSWGQGRYEINDALLEKYHNLTFEEVSKEQQTRSSSYYELDSNSLLIQGEKKVMSKEKKSEIIREHLDVKKTVDENLEALNNKGIVVRRATVAVALAKLRRETGYTPPNKRSRKNGFTILDRKMAEQPKVKIESQDEQHQECN